VPWLGTIAAMATPSITIFKGLNNVSDSLRLGLGWLTTADNINITDTGAIEQRNGYSLTLAGNIASAYATLDAKRLYLIDSGSLKAMAGTTAVALLTLTAIEPMYWCEINDRVFFNNGIDSGIIEPDNTITPWRESTLADLEFLSADGTPLSALLDPLPLGTDVIQAWKGRIYAAQYMPTESQSVIWFSQPLGFHLFALDKDFIVVPGRVLMLAPHDDALLIGTDQVIYAYADSLAELAPYGVVPGQHWSEDKKQVFFWTTRGLCSALPFVNHTEEHVSVAPGVRAGGAVLKTDGQRRYVVAIQQGNVAYNSR